MRYIQTLLPVFVLAIVITPDFSRAQNNGYAVTERGADYKVLQKTTVEHGTNRVHQYTELATGLNYTNSYGQWTESKEEIDILPNGTAAATQGQHKVYFPPDIYDGVLEVVTPDGRHLKSRPLGVSYDDGSNTVFIATLQHSQGLLTSSNQVTYPDAFTDFKADLVCTYRKSGFECDLVFRQQPPAPDQYGLDDDSSTLQLVTEFFNTADPQQIPAASDESFGLQDSTLKFGALTMTHGKAFAIKSRNSQLPSASSSSPVYKRWLHLQGRTFLIEEVPLVHLADDLQTLPAATNALTSKVAGKLRMASNHLQMPPAHELVADSKQILIASTDFNKNPGVVLDFCEIDTGGTDFTFHDGTTYYINGVAYFFGTVTFEGGAVIKFSSGGAYPQLGCFGTVTCPTSADKPVILTSKDDDTVGCEIDGSSGSPGLVETYYFVTDGSIGAVNNFRFYYAADAVWLSGSGGEMDFRNCQFVHCSGGIGFDDYSTIPLGLFNVLFSDCYLGVEGGMTDDGQVITAEQVTADTSYFMIGAQSDDSLTLNNSIVLGSMDEYPGTVTTDGVVFNPTGTIFKTAANANYYLTNDSPYRDVGTTDIDSDLLADIQTMTTYAPQDGGFPDTDTPDYGYHYPVNEDSDYDGIPDWWIWKYFGNYNENGTNLDTFGNTLLDDYETTTDPNQIQFSLQFTNTHVNTNYAYGNIAIQGGIPSYMAVLAGTNDFTNAVWQPYDSNVVAVLGSSGDGNYVVWVGVRGLPTDAEQTWLGTQLTLDTVPPVLTITNPVSSTVSQPVIELQGFANESLASLTFDVSNAAGVFTNQTGFLTGQFSDTNLFTFTTNYFQCYDIALTNGLNQITLHATDLAGNQTTTNANLTLDYSGDHTAPVLSVLWPTNDTFIDGSNFTLQAQMDDPTATVTASVNGSTVQGLVEQNGSVWVNNLMLNTGTNAVTVTATDAAGNSSVTNFNVIGTDVGLTINPLTSDQMNQYSVSVSGTVGSSNDVVTVNGVSATVNDDGTWEADAVPVNPADNASLNVQVNDSGGNPVAAQSLIQPQPSLVQVTGWQDQFNQTDVAVHYCDGSVDENSASSFGSWKIGVGGFDGDGDSLSTNDPPAPPWSYASIYDSSFEDNIQEDGSCAGPVNLGNQSITIVQNTQTALQLVAGGAVGSGVQRLVRVTVAVLSGGVNVPLSAINLLGQVPAPTATNANVGEVLVSLSAGSVRAATPMVKGFNSYTADVQANDVNFGLTVVSNSATEIGTTANWAVVKSPTTDYVIVQATLNDTNLIPSLIWSGGEAVSGNPLQRRVSKTTSAETTVTAILGSASQSLNVWVIWANLTVKVSGTLDPDDKAAVLDNGNFPTPQSTTYQYGLGGGNSLGPIDWFSNTNLNYGYAIGKMEAKAILQPSGIGNLLISTNTWNLKRTVIAIAWDNGGSPTYTTGGSNPPSAQNDTGGDYFKYLNPINGDIFDLDWPACPILSGQIPNHTSEVYDNFYEYVTVNLGSGDQFCSATNTYSYTAQIDFDATTNNVQLNSLSTSLITLPTTPHYTPR